jgi:hypothetical protein
MRAAALNLYRLRALVMGHDQPVRHMSARDTFKRWTGFVRPLPVGASLRFPADMRL